MSNIFLSRTCCQIYFFVLLVSISLAYETNGRSSLPNKDFGAGSYNAANSRAQPDSDSLDSYHAKGIRPPTPHGTPSFRQESISDSLTTFRSPEPTTRNVVAPQIVLKRTLTVAVVGRSGSGISSTIRELIGPKTTCAKPSFTETSKIILQYSISGIPSASGPFTLRLLDVPGWVDGRTSEEESQILASLKSYVEYNGPPDFYLAISRFDDSRIDGIHSLFVQSLKRLELFHEVFLNTTYTANPDSPSNILFILTRLMSETKLNQRKPDRKMQVFRQIIENFAKFRNPIQLAVGENNAITEYEVPVDHGYARLPNKELFPKNIWLGLKNLANHQTTLDMLENIINNRETQFGCEATLFQANDTNVDDDSVAFTYLLGLGQRSVSNTEVNHKIDQIFRNATKETQIKDIVQKIALQVRLQEGNYTETRTLPSSNFGDRAAFFQSSNLFSALTPAFYLNRAFNLEMPEYTLPLTIGMGYDLTTDDMTTSTPFEARISTPNSVGYQLPNFMRCRKLVNPDVQAFRSYSANISEYLDERLKYLDCPDKDNLNTSSFEVKVKEGFNLAPEADSNMVTLSTVQEFRTVACKLVESDQWLLQIDFLEEVDRLVSFDKHDRDSVLEWKSFFSKWGTHVISRSFGGGSVHGTLVGSEVREVLGSKQNVTDILTGILRFSEFSVANMGTPKYRVFGGDVDPRTEEMYNMEEKTRKQMMADWEKSLNSNFVMLNNEFGLVPISEVISEKISTERGDVVKAALGFLLRGELVYVRKPRQSSKPRPGSLPSQGSNRNPTQGQSVTTVPHHGNPTHAPYQPFGNGFTHESGPRGEPGYPGSHHRDLSEGPFQPVNPTNQPFVNTTHSILQLTQDQMNLHIRHLEREMQSRQNKNDADYAAREQELARLKAERRQRSEQRQNEMKASLQRVTQDNRDYYQRQTQQIDDEIREIERERQSMTEMLNRRRAESEAQHQRLMEQIRLDNERLRREQEEANRCKGTKWFGCAKDTFTGAVNSILG